MRLTLFQYSGCSTCRRARKLVEASYGVPELVDLKESPPDVQTLRALWQASGLPLRKFFNTSGQSYREGGWKDRISTISEEDALLALAADGMLVKRPLLRISRDDGDVVFVGLREDQWMQELSKDVP